MSVDDRLNQLGLELPGPMAFPPALRITWAQVRVVGARAVVAGHGPRALDGGPFGRPGKVGSDLTPAEGYAAARAAGLAVLGDLRRELGSLDRVRAWTRVFGMVNSAPGFVGQPGVVDGFTDLMIALWGEAAAVCPRAVMGAAELPMNAPVIIEGEAELVAG